MPSTRSFRARRHFLATAGATLGATLGVTLGATLGLAALPRPGRAATQTARLPASTPIVDGDFVPAPTAWLRMVERFPEFDPGSSAPCEVGSTTVREAELDHVQRLVNRSVGFRPDTDDLWQPATLSGDCEDFALLKLRMLTAEFGWPRGALSIATCRAETGQLHAVLLAHMARGAYALDNRRGPVLPWRALPYRWKAREVAGAPFLLWRAIAA